ncbi:MAG: putative nucleic acid-binding protein [Patescibacteria group bacterium]|jgi:predicted nucleic acid-binding protein
MNKYALDSSAWIQYFTKPSKELQSIIEERDLVTSIIAIAEIADKFSRQNIDISEALSFIKEKAKIIELTIEISLHAAELKTRIRKKKPKFGLADAIHLSSAYQEDAVFVTKDADFSDEENVLIIY